MRRAALLSQRVLQDVSARIRSASIPAFSMHTSGIMSGKGPVFVNSRLIPQGVSIKSTGLIRMNLRVARITHEKIHNGK
jgi:hypothetical protein